jgi:hypothetical protein
MDLEKGLWMVFLVLVLIYMYYIIVTSNDVRYWSLTLGKIVPTLTQVEP